MAKQEAPAQADEPTPPPEVVILRALQAVMNEVDYVQRDGKNDFHGYSYATEANVLERLRPAMLKHGLILIPSIGQVSPIDQHGITTITVLYTLAHVSGAVWPEKIIAAGQGGDSNKKGVGDKGLYKAITGANKYLLFKLFQIETGDAEPEDPKGDEDRAQPKTDEARRRFYKEGGLIAISKAETAADLRKWWEDDRDNRIDAGCIKGTPEYADLYAEFLKRGNFLAAKEKV